ncbi:MAG: hypothetical protein IK125_07835 [Lachnospiraceae bacterium]|nr:hypothetical protein [Lachnospiraceae bacterium]
MRKGKWMAGILTLTLLCGCTNAKPNAHAGTVEAGTRTTSIEIATSGEIEADPEETKVAPAEGTTPSSTDGYPIIEGTFTDTYHLGYLSEDNKPEDLVVYLIDTRAELDYVTEKMGKAVSAVIGELSEKYPFSDYDYLFMYTEYSAGGYYHHADSVQYVGNLLFFHHDVIVTPEGAVTCVMDGDMDVAAVPKAFIENNHFLLRSPLPSVITASGLDTTTAPLPDEYAANADFSADLLLLDILEGREIPVLVEYGYGGEAGYSLCSAKDSKIINEFIEALNDLEIEECISETEQISYYADAFSDVIFTTSDGRKATVGFDNLEYMYVGNATYKIKTTARLSNVCEFMEYVPFLAEIEDGYIAVFHGGVGERTYETYVYRTESGYKFYNVTSTTVSWGSPQWVHKVNDYGYTDTKEDIVRRARAHGASQFVSFPDDTTPYPIDTFLQSKEG